MPQTKPDSLSRQTYLDIVAFMLRANNVSVGKNGLSDDAPALKKLKISRQ